LNDLQQKLIRQILETIARKFPIDFLLFIGDNPDIEPVFTYLNNKKHRSAKFFSPVFGFTKLNREQLASPAH